MTKQNFPNKLGFGYSARLYLANLFRRAVMHFQTRHAYSRLKSPQVMKKLLISDLVENKSETMQISHESA